MGVDIKSKIFQYSEGEEESYKNNDLIYKDGCYQLIGCAFDVFNTIGYGYREKYYQRAFEEELKNAEISYEREVLVKLPYRDKIIGRYFIDFVIDDKIAIELKVANDLYTKHTKQILNYLTAKDFRLGILIIFTSKGVIYKRFVN